MPAVKIYCTATDVAAARRIVEKMREEEMSDDVEVCHVLASAISIGMAELRAVWDKSDPPDLVVPLKWDHGEKT